MFINAFLGVTTDLINLLLFVFKLVEFAIPDQIEIALNTAFSGIGYYNTFFPFDVLISAVIVYLNFLILLYGFKIIRWVYAHIPVIGRHKKTPDLTK